MKELPDELLVYDLRKHRAHCLNRTAGLVWRAADGKTAPGQIAARLSRALDAEVDEAVVWQALEVLEQAELLDAPLPHHGPSRRSVLRALAFAVPAVLSVAAPAYGQAARSCLGRNRNCTQGGRPPCCPGLTCRCVTRRRRVRCRCR